ncbi:hypothetical protein [Micromonospora cathayae]|uniref:Integral membrane protein n=1 Tax=Micromonospora cathayae TaxID=3028804 RepID=A0ABY7ZXK7_9ACTN|nr:hypothetical protein [Micromonospora sp. HUAS 3]WDZ87131.1 hypothetical protein PVK37_12345 [Micromonospora sp. HUAS 3]
MLTEAEQPPATPAPTEHPAARDEPHPYPWTGPDGRRPWTGPDGPQHDPWGRPDEPRPYPWGRPDGPRPYPWGRPDERRSYRRAGAGGRHRTPHRAPSVGTDGRRLLAICGWATALDAVALASGLRGLVLVLAGQTPSWYQPTVTALGLGGIVLGALAVRGHARAGLPWTALGLANLAVGVSAGLTISLP